MEKDIKPKAKFFTKNRVITTAFIVGTTALVSVVVSNTLKIRDLNAAAGSMIETIDILLEKVYPE